MSDQWHYKNNHGEHGPYSSKELKSLADDGSIVRTDLIRKDASRNWRPAHELNGLFSNEPPPIPDNDSPRETAGKLLGGMLNQLGSAWNQVSRTSGLNIVNSVRERLTGSNADSEPYVPGDDSRELFRGMMYKTMPESLSKMGTKVRVVLEGDQIVFVRKVMLGGGGEFVISRYVANQLVICQQSKPLPVFSATGIIYGTVQEFRNTDKYGIFDGKAATNLQNGGKSPDITHVPGINLGFKVPDDDLEAHAYTIGASSDTKEGSFREAVFLLGKFVRQPTQESVDQPQLLDDLRTEKARIEENQGRVKEKLDAVREDREATREEIRNLRAELESQEATPAPTPTSPDPPDANLDLIKQLAALREAGLLSDSEFEDKKKQILDRI